MGRLARQPSGMFDQGLFTVLGDVPGEHGGAHLPAILTGAELEKARVDAADIQVDASVLSSAYAQPKQVHVTLLHHLWLFRHY